MGNSPSQQTAEGAQGEPDNFDLDAISDGSGHEETTTKETKTASKEVSKTRKQHSPRRPPTLEAKPRDHGRQKVDYPSAATNEKPGTSSFSEVPDVETTSLAQEPAPPTDPDVDQQTKSKLPNAKRKRTIFDQERGSTERRLKPLDDYDYPLVEIQDPRPEGPAAFTQATSIIPPIPTLKTTRSKKTSENKRKRTSFNVQESPARSSKRQRPQQTYLPTSVTSTKRELEANVLNEANTNAGGNVLALTGSEAVKHATVPTIEEPGSPQRLRKPHLPSTPRAIDSRIGLGDEEAHEFPPWRGMATSVAKRTFPFVVKKAGTDSPNLKEAAEDADSALKVVEWNRGRKTVVEVVIPTSKAASTIMPASKATSQNRSPGSALKRPFQYPRSLRSKPLHNLDTKVSENKSESTVLEPKSAIEKNTYRCLECEKEFELRKLLKQHEEETGHGQKVSGRFSSAEVQKLEEYKNDFCTLYDIDGYYFNEMMTESCRRGTRYQWSYAFITKKDFLAQYFEVLPNRNRKSMARYRERNWQNATGSKDWTKDDDDQISKLVKEIGPRWVEIGQRLTRTQDAVRQRWKKYLEFRDKIKRGVWTGEETERLTKAIATAKKKGALSQDSSTDQRIAWSVVSDALDNTRTPKQCADRWIFLQDPEKHRQAQKRQLAEKKKTSRPSSDQQKKELSKKYIDASDDELSLDNSSDEARDDRVDAIKSKNAWSVQDSSDDELEHPNTASDDEDLKEVPAASQQSEDNDFVSASQSSPGSKTQHSHESSAASEKAYNETDDEEDLGPSPPDIGSEPRETTSPKITTLGQAFAITQANASARRKPRSIPARDRPSPNIPMKLRPQSPVVKETPIKQDDSDDFETQEVAETLEPSTLTPAGVKTTTASTSNSDTSSEGITESSSDEDEEVFGVSKKHLPAQAVHTASSTSSSGDSESGSESGSESADVDDTDAEDEDQDENEDEDEVEGEVQDHYETASITPRVGSTDARISPGAKKHSSSEDETSSDGETASGSVSDSDSDTDSDSNSDSSMVNEVRNDFMASIQATARRAELARQNRKVKYMPAGDSDSEESEDGDIEHGGDD